MKDNALPAFERLMIFSALISFGLLFYRCLFNWNFQFTYLLWNLLLAYTPYLISKLLLKCRQLNVKAILLVSVWLILFPGCIYLCTDILQMRKAPDFSIWYDGILYVSFAWNGLLPGLMSLKNIETFLRKHLPAFMVKVSTLFFIFLSSYSICLVRFLHLKNWHILTHYKKLLQASANNILNPQDHVHAWLTVISLVMLFDVIYVGFKKLYFMRRVNQKLLL